MFNPVTSNNSSRQMVTNYKGYLVKIILVVIGILLVLISLFADKMGIGQGPKDHFGFSQWLMLATGVAMAVIGVVNYRLSLIVMMNLVILLPMLLLVDNVLYSASPWLPENLVQKMSYDAQVRHMIKNGKESPMVKEGESVFYKPNYIRYVRNDAWLYDEFGYRNPPGYIAGSVMDVILLGDSFTEGQTKTTIADYLRIFWNPRKVYSLGTKGQGIPHWSLHFKRYRDSEYFKSAPKIVILNFYSGNDISDTISYELRQSGLNDSPEKPASHKHKFSFFGELIAMMRNALYFQGYFPPPQEPTLEEVSNPIVVQALSKAVNEIRSVDSKIIILLSYIATSAAIYGTDIDRCLSATRMIFPKSDCAQACKSDVRRQTANSNFLHKLADNLKIEYLDPTSALRRYAQKSLLHVVKDGHFNDEANRIYSEEIVKKFMKP